MTQPTIPDAQIRTNVVNATIDVSTRASERELPHKLKDIQSMCCNFVSDGWKLISPTSLKCTREYHLSIFKRDPNPDPVAVFFQIFDSEIFDLLLVISN